MNDKRSSLACPNVIADSMPPTEQVDGRVYESKAAFRAKGRELGLTEVGDQNLNRKPKRPVGSTRAQRLAALELAAAQYRAGRRPKRPGR